MNKNKIRMIFASVIAAILLIGIGGGLYIHHEAESYRKSQTTQSVQKKKAEKKNKKTVKKKEPEEKADKETEDGAYINKNTQWNLGKLPVTEIQEQNIKIRISKYIADQKLGMIANAYLWNAKGIQQDDRMTEFFVICQMTDGYYVTFDVRAYKESKDVHIVKVLADYSSPESVPPTSNDTNYTTD